jgi:hypothetical protein
MAPKDEISITEPSAVAPDAKGYFNHGQVMRRVLTRVILLLMIIN